MEEQYAVCRVSIAPLRASASDRAEIVSQLLFGDTVVVLEKAEPWWQVRTLHDDYEGWMDFKQLALVDGVPTAEYMVPAQPHNAIVGEDGSRYYLAASSSLPGLKDGYCTVGPQRFKLEFEPVKPEGPVTADRITNLARFFENAPYLWGGRTLFGIDCSGFVQAVFKLCGLLLKRDASQQAEQGQTVDFLPAAKPGDVAFFDNAEGRITHVGILLSGDRIIHAAGKVRIDPIDDQGIFNKELNRYTHQLRIIKRMV